MRLRATCGRADHGPALKHLPPAVTWTCRLRANASCTAWRPPASPAPGDGPAARAVGWAPPGQLAAAARQSLATVRIYRRDQDMSLAGITCLWYGCLDTAGPRRGYLP